MVLTVTHDAKLFNVVNAEAAHGLGNERPGDLLSRIAGCLLFVKTKREEMTIMVGKGKPRVKVNKLKVNKETVKDLTKGEKKKIEGGRRGNGETHVITRLCDPPKDCACSGT